MVYVDPKNLGYVPFFEKWMGKWLKNKEKNESLISTLDELFLKYVPVLINLIFDGVDGEDIGPVLHFALPRTNLNLV